MGFLANSTEASGPGHSLQRQSTGPLTWSSVEFPFLKLPCVFAMRLGKPSLHQKGWLPLFCDLPAAWQLLCSYLCIYLWHRQARIKFHLWERTAFPFEMHHARFAQSCLTPTCESVLSFKVLQSLLWDSLIVKRACDSTEVLLSLFCFLFCSSW